MRVLNNTEYDLLERLVSLTQKEMRSTLGYYLQKKYPNNVIMTKDYIVAVGDIPIALVAHMDTVFSDPPLDVYYDQRKGVMWSPDGLGADDRAGIFAILYIIKSGLRPSIILTTDEEKGGVGAQKLAKLPCPIPNLKYLIQLDRRGDCDCVFYDCYAPDFVKYIECFGFVEKLGSFTDISFLMPAWNICGVNLSVGYENEHSVLETLNVNSMFATIDKVIMMLSFDNIPTFKFNTVENSLEDFYKNQAPEEEFDIGKQCCKCGSYYFDYEMIPALDIEGNKKNYCCDCATDSISWCDNCGEPFDYAKNSKYCKNCEEKKFDTKAREN